MLCLLPMLTMVFYVGDIANKMLSLKVRKKAVRAITKSHYKANTQPLFKELHILKVGDLLVNKELSMYYQIVIGYAPEYVFNFNLDPPQSMGLYNLRCVDI